MKLKTLLILTSSILFFNCSSDSTDDVTTEIPDAISYTNNVKAIMDQSCATSGCHDTGSNKAGLTLETYTQVKNAFLADNALQRMENTSNPMPPSGVLPDNTIKIIKNWQTQGYIE